MEEKKARQGKTEILVRRKRYDDHILATDSQSDRLSENVWFVWSKSSNTTEKISIRSSILLDYDSGGVVF